MYRQEEFLSLALRLPGMDRRLDRLEYHLVPDPAQVDAQALLGTVAGFIMGVASNGRNKKRFAQNY